MIVQLIRSDLEFILQQIVIAERHAAGEDLLFPLPNSLMSFGDPDGLHGTDDVTVEGKPAAPISPTAVGALRTGHMFLADILLANIAHSANPFSSQSSPPLAPDADNSVADDLNPAAYDDGLLAEHFVADDGRVNENISLTALRHVLHAEHNRLVEHTKDVVLASNDVAFLNEWLAVDVPAVPTIPAEIGALQWNGERLFQAAKFGTEMQYQHLVFEEFARKIQPNVDAFHAPAGFDSTINPASS